MTKQKAAGVADRFANIVYATVTESVADTLTFQQIQTGYGSLEKVGWVISRLEYYVTSATQQAINAAGDYLQTALVTSNLISELSLASSQVLDMMDIQSHVVTGVGFELIYEPLIRDFSNLPGGGKLCLPYPIYLAVDSNGLALTAEVSCRINFTEIELQDQEWMELVQQTRLLT